MHDTIIFGDPARPQESLEETLAKESKDWLYDRPAREKSEEQKLQDEIDREMKEAEDELREELEAGKKSEGRTKHGW